MANRPMKHQKRTPKDSEREAQRQPQRGEATIDRNDDNVVTARSIGRNQGRKRGQHKHER